MCLTELQHTILKSLVRGKKLRRETLLKSFPTATQKDLSHLVGEGYLKGDGEFYHRTAEGMRAVRRPCPTPQNK